MKRLMFAFSPYATLILLLAAASGILIAGSRFARREEHLRIPADRKPLEAFAASMSRELTTLERLYEKHLRQLARDTAAIAPDEDAVWRKCDGIVGVTQWSLLHPPPDIGHDLHILIDTKPTGSSPEPTFHIDSSGLPRPQVLLSADDLLGDDAESWGWIDEPGKPLLFWQRVDRTSVVVESIDLASLRAVLNPWLANWAADSFGPLRVTGAPAVSLASADGLIASSSSAPGAAPDFLLPLHSRFGDWQLAAWDHVETRVHYDLPTLTISGVIAVMLALIGLVAFAQQRRMLALSTQRVTFVNRVSHELRTPLTNMLLNLDLAAESLDDPAPEPLRRLSLVREEATRLGHLIENVLTFSRSERKRLAHSPSACVPSSVIQAVVRQFEASFARRALTVRQSGDVSTPLLLDPGAFAQILSNLLSNVEKYVPGGIVDISSRIDSGALIVTVTDDGPGIAARDAGRIFKPFERLNTRVNEGSSGTGLGLTIARDLSTAAGGSLRLIPSHRGASFELRLPAPAAPNPRIVSAA